MNDSRRPFWIEVLSRRDEVIARHKAFPAADGGVHVGRGYDNDVIVDDPYVAARHLRIVRDDSGRPIAEDLGSANGLYLGDDRRRVARAPLDNERVIRIGRTYLRVRETDHPVPPERVSRPGRRAWPVALGIGAAAIAVDLANTWLTETAEAKLGQYLGAAVTIAGFVAAWATGWAIMSRIFSGRARFERHLLIAASGMLALSLLNDLSPYAAYAFSRAEFTAYRYVVTWLAAGTVCFLHLRIISASRESGFPAWRLKAAALAGLTALAIGMQTLSQWEDSATSDRQHFIGSLKPPALRLVAAQSAQDFFADVSRLRQALEQARSEPIAAKGNYAGSDDD